MAKSANLLPPLLTHELLIVIAGKQNRVERDPSGVRINGVTATASLAQLGADVFELTTDSEKHIIVVVERRKDGMSISVDGWRHDLQIDDALSLLRKSIETGTTGSTGMVEIKAPMPGLITRILVSAGDAVVKGQGLLILEAMKMENELRAAADGRVESVNATIKTPVEKGEVLLRIHHEQRNER
jgi:biotin carboxyl carrier protein